MFLNTLSGRFLMLTIAFVMLAEVLIFVPSIARYREDFLLSRLERAQIASLALLATDEVTGNLRQLRSTATLSRDIFSSMQEKGIIEPRKAAVKRRRKWKDGGERRPVARG